MMDVCFFADEVSKDFAEAVKLGVEAGANAVEVRGGIWGKTVTTIDDDDVKRMQDVLAKHGARVASIGSPFGKCHHDQQAEYEQHLRYFDRMVELAHAFDTRVIRGFAFWNPARAKDVPRPNIAEYLDTIVKKLSPVIPIAEREGVTLSLENEGATLIGTCQEARTVIDALGNSSALTVCWDVMNGLGCGETPYPDGYAQIKGLVTHLHVKPNKHQTLNPVGSTHLTYEDLFRAVLADGFQGAASIEHWGTPELMLKGVRELRAAIDGMS
ncbi:MAG: sugar phosphate isomerase/epimerase [Candidatus Poribacteria bacterium]|nr:sugar phosphate isomerase/epimerase [Candidatus Poribacteria bacterium]